MSVIIKSHLFDCFVVIVEQNSKILDIKKYIETFKGIPIKNQLLYINGHPDLDDSKTLIDYNINADGNVIYFNTKR